MQVSCIVLCIVDEPGDIDFLAVIFSNFLPDRFSKKAKRDGKEDHDEFKKIFFEIFLFHTWMMMHFHILRLAFFMVYIFEILTAFLITGTTFVPNNSIDCMIILCGTFPTLACARNLVLPNNSCSYKILSITCCTLPTIK